MEERPRTEKDCCPLKELLTVLSPMTPHCELPIRFLNFVDRINEHKAHVKTRHIDQIWINVHHKGVKPRVSSLPWNNFQNMFGCTNQVICVHKLMGNDNRE